LHHATIERHGFANKGERKGDVVTTKARKFVYDKERRQQAALKRLARYEHEEQQHKEQREKRRTFRADLNKAMSEATKKKPDFEPLRLYLLSMALMAESDAPQMDVIAHSLRTISRHLFSQKKLIPRTTYLKNLIVDVIRARIAQERARLKLAPGKQLPHLRKKIFDDVALEFLNTGELDGLLDDDIFWNTVKKEVARGPR
jgi:hypothetical protein